MSVFYPFLLKPCFDRRPWGKRDLNPIYDVHVKADEEPIGEAWLTTERCQVAKGPLAGTELGELCRRYGHGLVGSAAPYADHFPLLIKFLFPREKLSVQVHPDDETARRQGQPCGKTECWYVIHSEPGAQIGLGLKAGVTRDALKRAIHEGYAEKMLNWIDVHPGEMYYVDAGTVVCSSGSASLCWRSSLCPGARRSTRFRHDQMGRNPLPNHLAGRGSRRSSSDARLSGRPPARLGDSERTPTNTGPT